MTTPPQSSFRYRPESDTPADTSDQGGTTYLQLNDEIGREALDGNEERDREIITGTVVDCRKDEFGDTYYYFDNGQVWKQKTDSRTSFEDCNFDVTISKDFFGYKMQRVGEKRRIRISRLR